MQPSIYLDLDGVILPYNNEQDYVIGDDGRPSVRMDDQEAVWLNRFEFYYLAIAKRLGGFAARGCQIILSSSRSYSLYTTEYAPLFHNLGEPERCLVIDRLKPNYIEYKAEAVLNHFQGVKDEGPEKRGWERGRSMIETPPPIQVPASKAVWVEDLADAERLRAADSARASQILDEALLLIIQPRGEIGLTMTEIDRIDAFLS